jgi:hypothetical protein
MTTRAASWRANTREHCSPMFAFAFAIAILCVFAVKAFAHQAASGWTYPLECCSDRDCAEYPAENVQILSTGFLLKPTGEFIDRSKARVSPDGRYHLCRYPAGTIICFFYPPPST